MHILVYDVSGRQYILPAKEIGVLPGHPDCSAAVKWGALQVSTRETLGELTAMLEACGAVISLENLKAQQEDGKLADHCQAINERAERERILDDRQTLIAYGPQIVNAVNHMRRSTLHLPVNGPLIFEKDGETRFHSQNASEAAIKETAKTLRNMDGEEITRAVDVYEEHKRLTAGGDA